MTKITTIRPLPGYCLIEPIEDELKSGDVYLPEQSKDKPSKGKIVDVGVLEGLKKFKPKVFQDLAYLSASFGIGDIIIYKKWTNQEVQHKGKTYLLVRFDELLAVIE